jgi:hypothetical protein
MNRIREALLRIGGWLLLINLLYQIYLKFV